jgi:hypothetical protein
VTIGISNQTEQGVVGMRFAKGRLIRMAFVHGRDLFDGIVDLAEDIFRRNIHRILDSVDSVAVQSREKGKTK